ncbi:MAG: Transcriptional regulator, HxlR family [uncultured Solirubrobacteraceae bacterium]|uniref:Transcriptional regulator, HxlR family n=1 Tax=uncultured Solirubrobacteraceae bacterium TaxID=1162706 RepID=A0A6J4SF49_9ACTN|nr:MAG: Transcriptional regulator, HxlR family [uncultured Solirubrobacteraceae bacterium]
MTPGCCPHYHEAIELIGRRWTGAILAVLLSEDRPLRFNEIAQAVPDLSDRLLTERLKELEERGLVTKRDGAYAVTPMGRDLEPALTQLQAWGQRWLTA